LYACPCSASGIELVPIVFSFPLTSWASSVTSCTVGSPITAASFAPWIVNVTCWVELTPLLSVTVVNEIPNFDLTTGATETGDGEDLKIAAKGRMPGLRGARVTGECNDS